MDEDTPPSAQQKTSVEHISSDEKKQSKPLPFVNLSQQRPSLVLDEDTPPSREQRQQQKSKTKRSSSKPLPDKPSLRDRISSRIAQEPTTNDPDPKPTKQRLREQPSKQKQNESVSISDQPTDGQDTKRYIPAPVPDKDLDKPIK